MDISCCVGMIGSPGSNEIPAAIPSLGSSMTVPPAEAENGPLNEGTHPVNPRRFHCIFCYKSYTRPSRLEDHMMAHMGVERHVCGGQCGLDGW
jgi:hypothetical protein